MCMWQGTYCTQCTGMVYVGDPTTNSGCPFTFCDFSSHHSHRIDYATTTTVTSVYSVPTVQHLQHVLLLFPFFLLKVFCGTLWMEDIVCCTLWSPLRQICDFGIYIKKIYLTLDLFLLVWKDLIKKKSKTRWHLYFIKITAAITIK